MSAELEFDERAFKKMEEDQSDWSYWVMSQKPSDFCTTQTSLDKQYAETCRTQGREPKTLAQIEKEQS